MHASLTFTESHHPPEGGTLTINTLEGRAEENTPALGVAGRTGFFDSS